MKSIILAIVVFSFCLVNSSRAEIEVIVDRFDGSTTVRTKPQAVFKRLHFTLLCRYTGEAQKTNAIIEIVLIGAYEQWTYLKCNTTHWLVDSKPFELPQPIHEGEVGRGFVMELLTIVPVPLSALQQMAVVKKVEFKVCNDEFMLNKGEMEDLRKFVGIFKSASK